MGGSSGSSQPQQVTTTTANLPEYARPYFEDLLNRTGQVAAQNYVPYSGQRVANTNDFTRSSQNLTADIHNRGAPDIGTARQSLGTAAGAAGNTANFQAGNFSSDYNPNSYNPGQITAQQVGTQNFGPNAAGYYMSPYQQQVTDVQKNAAVLDYQRGAGARDDGAIRAGAFGGSRQAIQQGLAQQGLATQLGQIQAQGSQNAFTAAQQQFNADQARGLTAQQANQGANLTAQQQTEAARQFGANFGDSSQRYANDADLKVQQAHEDARQKAAGIQQAGGALANQTAQNYGQLAATDQTLGLQRAQAMGTIGTQMQQTQQAGLDMAYQDFINQRDYDRQNLNFYSGILRGTPVSAQSEVAQYQNPNPMNQAVGLGIAGLGAYKALS